MIAAYLRVSTGRQHLANQRDEIRRFAEGRNWEIDLWVTEVASGCKEQSARKLGSLLRRMKRGDILVVTEISRLSRTLTDVMAIMGLCLKKGIMFYTTKEGYVFDNSINSKVLCFAFGLVAEIERNLISMRTKEALALRRAEGVVLGRRKGSSPKYNLLVSNMETILDMIGDNLTVGEICRRFNISKDTFSKFRRTHPAVQEAMDAKKIPPRRRCRQLAGGGLIVG